MTIYHLSEMVHVYIKKYWRTILFIMAFTYYTFV